ncbi:MAG: hypothetical protein ACRDU8_05605, partial [Egibacteraceae bacterium]
MDDRYAAAVAGLLARHGKSLGVSGSGDVTVTDLGSGEAHRCLRLQTPSGVDLTCGSGCGLRTDGRRTAADRPRREEGRPGGVAVQGRGRMA